jgi:hypothetical protein
MGRPLKIQKLNAGVQTDAGYPQFANLDPSTQVIPVGMTSTEFLGVVGGANAGIATSTFPVVEITANVNGQQGAAYIITQKGTYKYLVSGEDSVNAGSFTPGFSYQILSLGNTDWTAIGAGTNPQAGAVFTATGAGSGSGTASDCGQCQLIANATIGAGQMNMVFNANGSSNYATRLTNKYIWDNATPPNRYAVNFFVAGETTAVTLGSVAVANTTGWFTANASTFTTGQIVIVSGTLTGNATITGYTDPTTYYVINTNGTTTFQLSATPAGANIATAAGNTLGLTFSEAVSSTVKSGADGVTFTNGTGDLTLAQVQNYTS